MLDVLHDASGIADAAGLDFHAFKHGEVEVCQRGSFLSADVAAGGEGAAAAAGEDDREVVVVVAVAVGDAGAVDDHGVV